MTKCSSKVQRAEYIVFELSLYWEADEMLNILIVCESSIRIQVQFT